MNSGYVKFYRKARDSASWNRGLMYRGLMIEILTRALWKKGSYQGRDLLPGQFGTVMSQFAESLGVPRSTLQRMVAHLEADDFLKVENVGNRFTIITVVNWHIYQESESRVWATGGQPVVNQRATGGQPSYKEEEKKERKNIKTPLTPLGGDDGFDFSDLDPGPEPDPPQAFAEPELASQQVTPVDTPANVETYPAGFEQFWTAYPVKKGKQAALRAYKRAKKAGMPSAEQLVETITRQRNWPEWQKDGGQYIPHPTTWLNQGRWGDEPTQARASPQGRIGMSAQGNTTPDGQRRVYEQDELPGWAKQAAEQVTENAH